MAFLESSGFARPIGTILVRAVRGCDTRMLFGGRGHAWNSWLASLVPSKLVKDFTKEACSSSDCWLVFARCNVTGFALGLPEADKPGCFIIGD